MSAPGPNHTPHPELQALEWPTLLLHAEALARTVPGKEKVQALGHPSTWAPDLASARNRQTETQEILGLLDREGLWGPLHELQTIDEDLSLLARSGMLELEAVVRIRGWLYAIDSWAQSPRDEFREGLFKKALLALPDLHEPIRQIDRIVTADGQVSERASSKLASLYSETRSLQSEIRRVLDSIVRGLSGKNVLQDEFSDVRDGRYVIPVRISAQNEVDGILHEASVSRQTVFIEPKEVTVLNNRLRQKQNDLLQELHRILQELSDRLRPFGDEIGSAVEILSHWDAVHARARLGLKYSGKTIEVTEDRVFLLEQTAHPLLWWALPTDQIIRNRIEYGEPARTLLLTGPNTGGKTVFLKTLGLAGVCARTGFTIPASGTPVVPFFDTLFVDVGDPQSIEGHLSSFSGHVLRFKQILEAVSKRSLVLLDELNSATDPEEGAALGRAFLETLMERGAMIVSTTHDPHLKARAIQDSRILSASMAFDEKARTPSYTILIGVPGRSRALETAARLGLPTEVLDRARSYLSAEHLGFEKMLSGLESDRLEAERSRKEAVRLREEAEKLRDEWSVRTEHSIQETLEKTRARLKRIVEQAQDEVRANVKRLDEAQSRREVDSTRAGISQASQDAVQRIETALKEEAPEVAAALEREKVREKEKKESAKSTLGVGSTVRVPKWKNLGTILSIEPNGRVKVALGALQISLAADEIEPLNSTETKIHQTQKSRSNTVRSKSPGWALQDRPAAPGNRLDLRGQRLDVAMAELERYLDLAFRSGAYAEVTVVTGLGTGAIREGARQLLKSLPYVKEFRDGGAGQGGTGATIVEFER